MVTTHNLGFARIGARRELKFALENYWNGRSSRQELELLGAELRRQNWHRQARLGWSPVGDFSLYDHVLDTSFLLGNVPSRARLGGGDHLQQYFRVARGRGAEEQGHGVAAGEMTKWFDTNYHYIVPEFTADTTFELDASRLLAHVSEAAALGVRVKPVIVGPLTYLWLGKSKDRTDKLALLPKLLPVYRAMLTELAQKQVQWVQLDEPVLVTELDERWRQAYRTAYAFLAESAPKVLLATYFGGLGENLDWVAGLPVSGVHLDCSVPFDVGPKPDFASRRSEVEKEVALLARRLPTDAVLSLGVVNGRNVWRSRLTSTLDFLEPIHRERGDQLWIAPSCSLLHVPVDASSETKLDDELRSWLAFGEQKLEEVRVLGVALNEGRDAVHASLVESERAAESRRRSPRVNDAEVRAAVASVTAETGRRNAHYAHRSARQAELLQLPNYPTTTIGSFPQTDEIRKARRAFKAGNLAEQAYEAAMRGEIARAVAEQEKLGLDVLVHGEAERNDMVEYFGEQLGGYAFSECGWVQSYGSRCVKPPILFGDVTRPKPMTVHWARYAQSLTRKPMKGMLTGPVTMLNWSFVRDDQPRSTTCLQLALAIREEVKDLERAGLRIIQIDEAALREGLPLRRSDWQEYLDWAIGAFRVAANGVEDTTQIHTHMCYSEFNDIIEAIATMDADVITIETSRSDMELLSAFEHFEYPNQLGPGVYDIHTPNVPTLEHIVTLLEKATERFPAERLWVNPDCGLKTRTWSEVLPALKNMVDAARELRRKPTIGSSQEC